MKFIKVIQGIYSDEYCDKVIAKDKGIAIGWVEMVSPRLSI